MYAAQRCTMSSTFFKVKEEIMRRAWNRVPLQSDDVTFQLLQDLSCRTLSMCGQIRPLLDTIRECGGTYSMCGVTCLASLYVCKIRAFF